MNKMKKLKNCYYKKVSDGELGHYFELYNKDKEYISTVLLWDTILTYNKYGINNED
jgi:hypothetical protein